MQQNVIKAPVQAMTKQEELVNNKSDMEEIDYTEMMVEQVNNIKGFLKKRKLLWKEKKEISNFKELLDEDIMLAARIQSLISKDRKFLDESKSSISANIFPLLKGFIRLFEKTNWEITKEHLKEERIMKTSCYQFKHKALQQVGKIRAKKQYVAKRITRDALKIKANTKKLINSVGNKDLKNVLKIWNVKYNLLKNALKKDKIHNKLLTDETEKSFKTKLKKEKKYK